MNSAGTYDLSAFDAAYTSFGGYLTPLLVEYTGGTTYIPIALGSDRAVTATTPFEAQTFGPDTTFTLAAPEEVYAALQWQQGTGDMAVGYITGGSIYSFNNGVAPATLGTALAGIGQSPFARTYDFSISVGQESVPEPMTLGLLGLGFAGIAAVRRRGNA
jgi:hypothetical protein